MSQAGIVDFIATHPEIPILFVCNMGSAVPIGNTLEILGSAVTAHSIPLETVGSGNTVNIEVQYSSAAASSVANNAGIASFNSTDFTVDANGYVTLSGSAVVASFQVDASTAPGTNPVVPSGSGIVTITGGQVAAGTTTNVIRTNSLAANTYTIQIQRSQAVGSSTVGDNGVSHFNSTYFTVDANGFVSINGAAIGETITGNTGGALSPTAGNWNILGTSTAPGTTPVQTSGTASTLTVQVQKAQAIASTNATNVGLAAFNSAFFTVDSNGFVSLNGSGSGETITGNIGGALSPTAGNWNILGSSTAAGTTPVQTSGSVSTLTVQVQKSQAIASTDATKVGLAAFDSARFSVDANGFVTLAGTGAGETITGNTGGALAPTAGNWNIVGTGSITTSGSVSTLTVQLTGLTNHAVQVGAGTATLTQVGPTANTGAVLQNNSGADPSYSTATYPSTTTINQILYSSAANTVTGLATVNSAVLVTTSTGVPGFSSTMTNGQVIIGSTGATPTAATLTAGVGISITNGASSITIASTAGGFTWNDKATSYSAVAENGYRSTATVTGSLPAAGAADGTTIKFQATTTNVHTISPATTDVIQIGNRTSTNGTGGGSIASTAKGDTIELVYQNSSGTWFAQSLVGNWTVV